MSDRTFEKINIMDIDTVSLDEDSKALVIIDQTKLPGDIELLSLTTAEEIWDAIYLLKVRGAPAIGVSAAIGMYVLASRYNTSDITEFCRMFDRDREYLNSSRPTAVNLSWALGQMDKVCKAAVSGGKNVKEVLSELHDRALAIRDEDIEMCRRIGENGLSLIKDGYGILTHCNAGKLATVRYGTATAPIYLAKEDGYQIKVYCDETRPLLQGARLTAFELSQSGIDTTLICDNMSAMVMKNGWVDAVFVGADRIAANGDTANKIGTSVVAAVARYYNIPVYICAPTSTIDMSIESGAEIVIEERNSEEVTDMWYSKKMAPDEIEVYNPAFDVTEAELISGIITEKGIARPPYADSLRRMFD